jgi:hypothetical protein
MLGVVVAVLLTYLRAKQVWGVEAVVEMEPQ